MKREDLEKAGLTAETIEKAGLDSDIIDKIMTLHGKDIESHKSRIETATHELDTIKSQLSDANKQIESFKDMDIESVKQSAADWEAKAKQFEADATQARADADARITEMQFLADLTDELKTTYRVNDPKDIIPQLNREKIQRGDNGAKFIGLDEQIKPLQESKSYLFASDEITPKKIVTGGKTGSVIPDSVVAAARKAAGLTDSSA